PGIIRELDRHPRASPSQSQRVFHEVPGGRDGGRPSSDRLIVPNPSYHPTEPGQPSVHSKGIRGRKPSRRPENHRRSQGRGQRVVGPDYGGSPRAFGEPG